jgi:CRP/FNR family transcriptional regulator, cyclic AMP receptor protein
MPVNQDYWHRLSPSEAAALRRRGQRRTFAKGQPLMWEGQVADRILFLEAGRVKIASTIATGREVVLAFCGPGELIGDLAALDGDPRSASVIALEPVETLALTAADFSAFLAEHPPAALALLQHLSLRLREADAKRVEFAAYGTLERVAIRLVELCERFGEQRGDEMQIALPLSQEELAGWAGASLESVSRALQTMRALGWIQTRRRHISVRDGAALRRAASGAP